MNNLLRFFPRTFLRGIVLFFILGSIIDNISPLQAQGIPPQVAQELQALKTSKERWIEINLTTQRLIAWEGKKPVYAVIVSTGKADTPTLSGVFEIYNKRAKDHMRGDDYDISDVPYAMYYDRGYAIHGAYWHHRFGTPISHGCINVAVDHAEWLFKWAETGVPVIIHP